MLEQVSIGVLEDMIEKGDIVVADFFATWCGPCKMMHPIVEQESTKHDNVKFVMLDVDECFEYCDDHHIYSVPTFVVFVNCKEVARKSGYMTAPIFADYVQNSISQK